MKLSNSLTKLLLTSVVLTSSLYAQDADTLNREVKQLEKQLKDLKGDAEEAKSKLSDEEFQEKQERIAENIAKASARTQKNIANAAKSEMYKRALALQEKRAAYLKDLAEGKVRPFPQVVENYEYYISQVASLTKDYEKFLITESAVEKEKLAAPILLALKPIGPWLGNARHGGAILPEITDASIAENDRLENRYYETKSKGPQGKLRLITAEDLYTLKYLPVPIQFAGAPNAEILLYSETGGNFPNGYSYISITTDESGQASTSWVSTGDAVANCSILYRSAELPEKGKINIAVKRLSLLPLEQISPVAKAATNKLDTLNPLNK